MKTWIVLLLSMAVLFLGFFAFDGTSTLTGFGGSSFITSRFIEEPLFVPSSNNKVTTLFAPRTTLPRGSKFIVYVDPPVEGGVYSRAIFYTKEGDFVQQAYICGMSSSKICTDPKRAVFSISRSAYLPGEYTLVVKESTGKTITLPFTVY